MWCFYVEVIELSEANPEFDYPLMSFELGKAPSEDSKEADRIALIRTVVVLVNFITCFFIIAGNIHNW